jgi:hypothetical protein
LPEEVVSWDDRKHGNDAMYVAKKAWTTPIPDGCTHRLVLQDDIEVCDNFLEIAEKVAEKHSKHIVSFFHCEKYPEDIRYVRTNMLWGCAIMIPSSLVPSCWDYIEHIPERFWYKYAKDVLRYDDNCILAWSVENQIPMINTVPSLVQHHGDISLVGCKEQRIAQDFKKSPPVIGW